MSYCWDTSAWVHSWVRTSPPDIFVSLWDRLDGAISGGQIRSPEEVYIELERQEGDTLLDWVKDRKETLISALTEDLQTSVTEIGVAFPPFIAGDGDRNFADPWVIALARVHGLTVVTQERRPGSPDSPTIPRVCDHFGVAYVNTFEFMRAEGWSF